jgi:hypothetical protein
MRKLLLATGLGIALGTPAHAQLFVPDSTFTVNATGSPGNVNAPANLTQFITQPLATTAGTLNLTVGIIDSTTTPGAEWLIFNYFTAGGAPISPTQGFWSVNEVGLQSNKAVNFIDAATQFDVTGTNQAFLSSPFSNFTPAATMPSDIAGILHGPGLVALPFTPPTFGPGPLPSLGAFLNPFSQLNGNLASGDALAIISYTEALEFAPAVPTGVPEPSTWAMMLTGFGLLGFAAMRKGRRGARLAA